MRRKMAELMPDVKKSFPKSFPKLSIRGTSGEIVVMPGREAEAEGAADGIVNGGDLHIGGQVADF